MTSIRRLTLTFGAVVMFLLSTVMPTQAAAWYPGNAYAWSVAACQNGVIVTVIATFGNQVGPYTFAAYTTSVGGTEDGRLLTDTSIRTDRYLGETRITTTLHTDQPFEFTTEPSFYYKDPVLWYGSGAIYAWGGMAVGSSVAVHRPDAPNNWIVATVQDCLLP